MKRRLLTILLFLLLGAAVNVAVAWGCLFLGMGRFSSVVWTGMQPPTDFDVAMWRSVVPDEFPPEPNLLSTARGVGISVLELAWFEPGELQSSRILGPAPYKLDDLRCGLPFRSIRTIRATKHTQTGPTAWSGDTVVVTPGVLPPFFFQLIWPGFAANSVILGVLMWLSARGAAGLYHWLYVNARDESRRKRGRCLKCNYDLRGAPAPGSGGCPECGWNREAAEP